MTEMVLKGGHSVRLGGGQCVLRLFEYFTGAELKAKPLSLGATVFDSGYSGYRHL